MRMVSRRWLCLLVVASSVDVVVAVVHGIGDVERFSRGARSLTTVLPIIGLVSLALAVTAAVGVARSARSVRRAAVDGNLAYAATKARLTSTIAERAVDVALQPIVDLASGELAGLEALSRFRDGRGPDAWYGEARETGQGLELDRLAFTNALRLLRRLPPRCYLSINASPELIRDPALRLELCSGRHDLERLVVEITEHVQIGNYPHLHDALAPLRERGVRLAIDDTGAGYASLSHVLQLRPDVIKIDRSLIADVTGDPARRSLVTALVLLALDLAATVTAEGVETPAELETLATLGVDHAQGFLLGRPSPDPLHWRRWEQRNWLQPTNRGVAVGAGPDRAHD
jgi:EAL domain-containing protein (putative c-di-GMP-specific phosphodiesterase class I)